MATKKRPHPDLLFAHKAAGLTVALFHVLLNNQKHYEDKHKEDLLEVNKLHLSMYALRQLQYLDDLANYLHNLNAIAPDELKTALAVIRDLHTFYIEHFATDPELIS